MFALAFVTALFTLTAESPALPSLFVLAPRKTARKPEDRLSGDSSPIIKSPQI